MKRKLPSSSSKNVVARRRVADVSGIEVQHLLKTLSIIQQQLKLRLGTLPLLDLSPPRVGGEPRKHIAQHTSLIGHLKRFQLTTAPSMGDGIGGAAATTATTTTKANTATPTTTTSHQTIFVEFGAGVGRFSDQLQEETKAKHYHLMIDRETFKATRLRDTAMKKRTSLDSVRRVTADIKDVNLIEVLRTNYSNVEQQQQQRTKIVAVSKHLCGEGFDMALSCLFEYHAVAKSLPTICMTPCCHCLCTWEQFTCRSFFETFGIGEQEFEAMCAVSQWASLRFQEDNVLEKNEWWKSGNDTTGGARVLTPKILQQLHNVSAVSSVSSTSTTCMAELVLERQPVLVAMSGIELEKQLTRREKRKLGRACKECIDIARACGILMHGYSECHLFRYTQHSTENLLLVGF